MRRLAARRAGRAGPARRAQEGGAHIVGVAVGTQDASEGGDGGRHRAAIQAQAGRA